MEPPYPLGREAKDKITGFSGIVIARTEWLMGCVRLTIQPQGLKDAASFKSETFDEGTVEITGPGLVKASAAALVASLPEPASRSVDPPRPGGPTPEPQRGQEVSR